MEKSGSKAVLELVYKHLCLSRHWGKIHRWNRPKRHPKNTSSHMDKQNDDRLPGKGEVRENFRLMRSMRTLYIGNNPASWKGNLDLFLPPANKCNSTQHFKSLSFTELKDHHSQTTTREFVSGQKPAVRRSYCNPHCWIYSSHWREISWKEKVWLCLHRVEKTAKNFRSEFRYLSKSSHY